MLCQLSYGHHTSLRLNAGFFSQRELQVVNVNLQAALQVSCLVLVNYVLLCELVQHCSYFGQKSLGSSLIGGTTQSLHRITSGAVVVLILQPF